MVILRQEKCPESSEKSKVQWYMQPWAGQLGFGDLMSLLRVATTLFRRLKAFVSGLCERLRFDAKWECGWPLVENSLKELWS